jgi:hypothetical protein
MEAGLVSDINSLHHVELYEWCDHSQNAVSLKNLFGLVYMALRLGPVGFCNIFVHVLPVCS